MKSWRFSSPSHNDARSSEARSLSEVEDEYFRLVFCGETCLVKAHKLVKCTSKDAGFKIQCARDLYIAPGEIYLI